MQLTLGYKGANSGDLRTATFNGSSWSGDKQIKDQSGGISPSSDYSPGMATLHNWLYLIYKGRHSDEVYACWFDGSKWYGNIKIKDMNGGVDIQSNYSPCLAAFDSWLFTVYKKSGTNDLYYTYFDGTTWYGPPIQLINKADGKAIQSNYTPGITSFRDKLYVVCKKPDSTDLHFASFDGMNWNGYTKIIIASNNSTPVADDNPGVTVYNDNLYITFKKSGTDDLYYAWYDGTTWYGNIQITTSDNGNPGSNYSPNASAYNNNLYIVYKGDRSNTLYSAWFNGSSWSGNTKIKDQSGDIDPESDHNPGMIVTQYAPADKKNWMQNISDSTLISNINLPGTHDSAAIRENYRSFYTCQNASIANQLNWGVRLLDIRIGVNNTSTGYTFTTCHSEHGSSIDINEYDPLPVVLDACKAFLNANNTETIIIIFKIDDWNELPWQLKKDAYNALADLLEDYPFATYTSSMPTLGSIRGKIFLYNRFDYYQDPTSITRYHWPQFGSPILWKDNTPGSLAYPNTFRNYDVWVQDQWKELPLILPASEKFRIVTEAFTMKVNDMVVLNFASATWYLFGIYIMDKLLDYFGSNPASLRPIKFGWTLFDYTFNFYNVTTYGAVNIVDLIISSNFSYADYPNTFHVIRKDEL